MVLLAKVHEVGVRRPHPSPPHPTGPACEVTGVPRAPEPVPAGDRAAEKRDNRRNARNAAIALGAMFGTLALSLVVLGVFIELRKPVTPDLPAMVVVAVFLAVAAVVAPLAVVNLQRTKERHHQVVWEEFELLRSGTEDCGPALGPAMLFNARLLDRFVCVALSQARAAYVFCAVSASVSLLVLIGGATVALTAAPADSQLLIMGVTALGSALSGYLTVTFLQTYRTALKQMNCYYSRPLAEGFILQAKQIADRLPADVDESVRSQIHLLMITETLKRGQEAQEQLFKVLSTGR
jgi:hypothetical protein